MASASSRPSCSLRPRPSGKHAPTPTSQRCPGPSTAPSPHTPPAPPPPPARRRLQTLARRKQAAEVVPDPSRALRPAQSFAAQTLSQALPRELLDRGLIAFDQHGRPVVATYDPSLLAQNPQRGRLEDRGLDELAASLDEHGQQEPVIARLLTPTDRRRWPEAFR